MNAGDFTESLQVLEKGSNARIYSPRLGRFVQADTITPSYSFPQSLNRFAYVFNSPVKFTDPSGRCPEGEPLLDGEICASESDLYELAWVDSPYYDLWWFVETFFNENGRLRKTIDGFEIDALEAMAQIVEKAVELYGTGGWDEIMLALSSVFIGHPMYGLGTAEETKYKRADLKILNFGDTGFHPDFQDTFNQVYHFWGYFANAVTPGSLAGPIEASGVVYYHDVLQAGWPWSSPDATAQDYALGIAAVDIGIQVSIGEIAPSDLANVLRQTLGTQGSGSDGFVDAVSGGWPCPLYPGCGGSISPGMYP